MFDTKRGHSTMFSIHMLISPSL